jgi:mono/diheme cytochrome c family protein
MNIVTKGAALVLLVGVASTSWSQDAPKGDAANGQRIYVAVGCFTCHGRVGQGGNFNSATPPLANTQWPVEALRAFLRVGLNDMPAFSSEVLTDQQVADIHAFLKSLPGSRSPADFKLLNQ